MTSWRPAASVDGFNNTFSSVLPPRALSTVTPVTMESEAATLANFPSLGNSHTQIQVIEWHMMEKWKFYPLSMLSSFTIRCTLYPFTVLKTCMQIQQHNNVYNGLLDACRKIVAAEGISGLYKGFWVSAFQIVSGVCYVSVYEGVRHLLYDYNVRNNQFRALVAGGCASLVGQTFIVPFDVISQHLMVVGQKSGNSKQVLNPLNIDYIGRTRFEVTQNITREIYLRDGLRGFYRGYLASLSTYVPNSAMWWAFYHVYQDKLAKIVPNNTSHLVVQCVSATLGGFTTTIITNPLDVCRARLQVQRLDSFAKTMAILWREEQLKMFTKGLSARLTQSAVFSSAIILGYETIKRLSVKEDFLDKVRW